MAKTNFTKVEGILDEGLRKISVDHLLELSASTSKPEDGKQKSGDVRHQTLLILKRDLKFLDQESQEPYELFGITKKNLQKYLKNPDTLTPEEWDNIKEIQVKVQNFKKEYKENPENNNDDSLIEKQRRRHITKRFNINEKWLPLT